EPARDVRRQRGQAVRRLAPQRHVVGSELLLDSPDGGGPDQLGRVSAAPCAGQHTRSGQQQNARKRHPSERIRKRAPRKLRSPRSNDEAGQRERKRCYSASDEPSDTGAAAPALQRAITRASVMLGGRAARGGRTPSRSSPNQVNISLARRAASGVSTSIH